MSNFKYLNKDKDVFDAEDSEDAHATQKQLDGQLIYYQDQLTNPPENYPIDDKIHALLQIARIQSERYQGQEAWDNAFEAFTLAEQHQLWEAAVEACNTLFLTQGPDALVALGHALWLGITFPVNPELTVAVLQHLVDESPNESDTKAVAATVAHYIAETRSGKDSDLTFFTNQLLASVADNHSHISDQGSFNVWHKAMGLDNPDTFLPKLSGAIDQLIANKWWVDKQKIYTQLDA